MRNTSADHPIAQQGSQPTSRRLVVASNRLPINLKITDKGIHTQVSSGGLVSALGGLQGDREFSWVGWPGSVIPAKKQAEVKENLAEQNLWPVFLSRPQEEHYYQRICNQTLWPMFHYFTDLAANSPESWDHYLEVNRLFAAAILEVCEPGCQVWVQDFHLMLVPEMLRQAQPDLEIGFFLHIPWPSSEIYRLLPLREALLHGLLGADYIAFHTNDYASHFRTSCLRVLGLESEPDGITLGNRHIGIGRHPIGIDTHHFQEVATRPRTRKLVDDLAQRYANRKLILGVERLDYTKGIPLKLQAFQRFLEQNPQRAKEVTLLQIIVPSRMHTPEYQELKRQIEEHIGRINGQHGGPGYTPIEYMYRSVSQEQLVALYEYADIGLVTPVRDGMNLIAQEFALCQEEGSGMLVLSEFAGAAQCLGESILVNPWDVEGTADAIVAALEMSGEERNQRMKSMVQRVQSMDCKFWAQDFLRKLSEAAQANKSMLGHKAMNGDEATQLCQAFAAAPQRIIILDYDGTLRELASRPELAQPTPEILSHLQNLAALPATEVHLVSGRPADVLQEWFGELPIHMAGEHGAISKAKGESWQAPQSSRLDWMPRVEQMLTEVTREVPGSMLERKQFSIAWHYRRADLDYGLWRARELHSTLETELGHHGVEVIAGHRVIEVRAAGINKGSYVQQVVQDLDSDSFILCVGDDRTDKDMYRALPAHGVSIQVGKVIEEAKYTIPSPAKVRELLQLLSEQEIQVASANSQG